MIDKIEEIRLVNAVTDGLPFACPICHEKHRNWDYLRICVRGDPNQICVHIKCLLNILGKPVKAIKQMEE